VLADRRHIGVVIKEYWYRERIFGARPISTSRQPGTLFASMTLPV
jgi:hypothetical protein